MSMFNTVVEPHPFAPILLRAINWAQPDDPEKKYPLLGRMRYVWIDENKNIKILLKDGPNSLSEEKDPIMDQIKNHETLVDVKPLERDPVYLVATFKIIMETSYDREIPMDELIENLDSINEAIQLKGYPSLLTDPFEIFDKAMEDLKNGKMTSKMEEFGKQLKSTLEESVAEDQLDEMTKDAGIDGFEKQKVKVVGVNPDGKFEDKTEEFMKKHGNENPGENS